MNAHSIDLQTGEHIVKEIRRDMFVFYTRVLILFILALLPLAIIVQVSQFLSQTTIPGGIVATILYLFFILFLTILFFFRWTDYYLDVWVLTNKRIFDIEQKGLFHRNISVFELSKIQDVNVEVRGILATFIKYGDVLIHTAGTNEHIVIKEADSPLEVKKCILEEYTKLVQESPAGNQQDL